MPFRLQEVDEATSNLSREKEITMLTKASQHAVHKQKLQHHFHFQTLQQQQCIRQNKIE